MQENHMSKNKTKNLFLFIFKNPPMKLLRENRTQEDMKMHVIKLFKDTHMVLSSAAKIHYFFQPLYDLIAFITQLNNYKIKSEKEREVLCSSFGYLGFETSTTKLQANMIMKPLKIGCSYQFYSLQRFIFQYLFIIYN